MQINLFEIIAQVINFFILLFILQKLFYKPVTEIMKKRQEGIEERLASAERKNAGAMALISEYEERMAEIETEKARVLEEIKEQALAQKSELLEKYEKEADHKRHVYFKEVEEEMEEFTAQLRTAMGKGAINIAASIINTVADKDLNERMFSSLLEKIRTWDADVAMSKMSSTRGSPILISAEEIDEDKKEQIERILGEKFDGLQQLLYRTDPSLVLGYELRFETYIIHANLGRQLDESQKNMMKFLEDKTLKREGIK